LFIASFIVRLKNKNVKKVKAEALKKVIQLMLNGERFPSLLMTIIRFVMPVADHKIKKLLLVFWEIVPKNTPDGKLMQEMILVCDAYRRDLQHPNEFIRGSTLRFLCKLKEPELLEPLMPSIKACLEYKHNYVRRNAVMAIFTIYKNFNFLMPDAPEIIANFLEREQDMSCKRNAFMMLIHADQERALNYLSSCIEQVNSFGDILQLVIVELIYKVCHANPSERARFIRCIYALLNSSSSAVRYEAAGTLITLSSAPSAVKAAASAYIELIVKESDNNVKLIVLDKLIQLKESPSHEKVLQELVMDILRVLSSPDLEVRRKTLNLCLDLVTSRTISEMVAVLKKELSKTNNSNDHEDMDKYRQMLVRGLHQLSLKFPDVAATILPVVVEYLSDSNELAACDVLVFIREIIYKYSNLKEVLLQKLLEIFSSIKSVKIMRGTLWILGEFCEEVEDIQTLLTLIRQSLGDLPIVDDELKRAAGIEDKEDDQILKSNISSTTQQLVTADGTYASQSAFSMAVSTNNSKDKDDIDKRPTFRGFLLQGHFFIAAALARTLTKLTLKYINLCEGNQVKQNRFIGEAMFIMASILHFGKSGLSKKPINEDDIDSINVCLRILAERAPFICSLFDGQSQQALSTLLEAKLSDESNVIKGNYTKSASASGLSSTSSNKSKQIQIQPDDPLRFGQLVSLNDFSEKEDVFDLTLKQAIGLLNRKEDDLLLSSKLNKVTQLTGFSDPVYAEAYVHVNQYDIVLDVLIVNQTSDTLQNLTLELATLGDLKLVEKPQSLTLAPRDFTNIKANIKVASTENGIIFGNIVYDISGAASDRNCVVLNDIHIDIMDYIVPAQCTDQEFLQMWVVFEWENKVVVNTNIRDLNEYLEHIVKSTNMKCLTPEKALSGECGFMAANLYAKSIFGEDVLANVSIEKSLQNPEAPVHGHIRIRAKSQGMALSMGDKINLTQKQVKTN
jgi:coatomer subunit beta